MMKNSLKGLYDVKEIQDENCKRKLIFLNGKKAFILKDVMVLIFLGSLSLILVINLYGLTLTLLNEERSFSSEYNDFIAVSERIKYDLYRRIGDVIIDYESKTIEFYLLSSEEEYVEIKKYKLKFGNDELYYLAGESGVKMKLSALIKGIDMELSGRVMTILFHYDKNTFRRNFRIR